MLWNLYVNEITKLFRRALYWAELAVLLGMCVLIFGISYVLVAGGAQLGVPPEQAEGFKQVLTWPGSFYAAIKFNVALVLGLLVIILVGAITAQEYPWRTLNLSVGHGISRGRVLIAKLLSFLTALAGWMLIMTVFVGVFTAFTGWQFQGSPDLSAVNFGHLGLSILRGMYALFPILALTFFFAVATRSAVTAIGIVVGYSLVVETLLVQLTGLLGGGLIARIMAFLPGMLMQGLLRANDLGAGGSGIVMSGSGSILDPVSAAAAIAVYGVFFLGLSFMIFKRQDLSS